MYYFRSKVQRVVKGHNRDRGTITKGQRDTNSGCRAVVGPGTTSLVGDERAGKKTMTRTKHRYWDVTKFADVNYEVQSTSGACM